MALTTLVQSLFTYHFDTYGRVWDSIMTLDDAQFVQADSYSRGSIRDQIVHVANADARWIRGLQGDPAARTLTFHPEAYATRAQAKILWDETAAEVKSYVDNLDETELQATPPGMGGPAWQALLHVVNHGTDHRAQILRQLHELDAPTFEQDLIYHFWQR